MSYKIKSLIYFVCFLITATAYYVLEHRPDVENNTIEIAEVNMDMDQGNATKLESISQLEQLEQ